MSKIRFVSRPLSFCFGLPSRTAQNGVGSMRSMGKCRWSETAAPKQAYVCFSFSSTIHLIVRHPLPQQRSRLIEIPACPIKTKYCTSTTPLPKAVRAFALEQPLALRQLAHKNQSWFSHRRTVFATRRRSSPLPLPPPTVLPAVSPVKRSPIQHRIALKNHHRTLDDRSVFNRSRRPILSPSL